MSGQVVNVMQGGKPVPCQRCGQGFAILIDSYLGCNCQDTLYQLVSGDQAKAIPLDPGLRNTFVSLAILGHKMREVAPYIPGQAPASFTPGNG